MAYEFYLGIDVHASDDGTRIAAALIEKSEDREEAVYRLHSLEQHADKSPPDAVQSLRSLITDDPFVGRTVCVLNVGEKSGREVHKALDDQGLSAITVSLTGGDTSSEQGQPVAFGDEGVHVSEHEVVETLDAIHRSGRLDISLLKTDEPTALFEGLEDYHVHAGGKGEALETIDATPSRDAAHAELVLAAGLAVWLAEQHSFDPTEHLAGPPPPVRQAKRQMRPDTA